MKSFALDQIAGDPASKRWIETRLLVKEQGEWVEYSYAWKEDQTEAELVMGQFSIMATKTTPLRNWAVMNLLDLSGAASTVCGEGAPELRCTIDLAASLASITGQSIAQDTCRDSFDISGALLGKPGAKGREHLRWVNFAESDF